MMSPLQTTASELAEIMEAKINEALGTETAPGAAELTVLSDLIAIVLMGRLPDPRDRNQRFGFYNLLSNRADGTAQLMVERVNEMTNGRAVH